MGCTDKRSPYAEHNVIVIVIDTLRSDRVNPSGDALMERLSRQAVCFNNAIAPASWTKPSVASIMTGLYPGNHGTVEKDTKPEGPDDKGIRFLDPRLPTMAECLKDAGYRTAGIITNPNIIPARHFDQGFDDFTQPAGNAKELFDQAKDWIVSNRDRGKFHLYLHAFDPHAPYFPPQEYRDRYVKDRRIEKAPFTNFGSPEEIEFWLRQYRAWDESSGEAFHFSYEDEYDEMKAKYEKMMSRITLDDVRSTFYLDFSGFEDPDLQERLEYLETLYNAEVEFVNHTLAAFFDFMEEEGILDDSIVVITADHGEAFLEHGDVRHDRSVHTEEVDVPLIFCIPGYQASLDEPVSLTDILPTILDIVGKAEPEGLDGISLWPYIQQGIPPSKRPVFTELIHSNMEQIGAIVGHRKLIYEQNHNGESHWRLYDTRSDPGEKAPVDEGAWDAGAKAMKEAILRFKKDRRLQRATQSAVPLTREEIDQLKELGY
jgi:arylsulfatase A-like enzyme